MAIKYLQAKSAKDYLLQRTVVTDSCWLWIKGVDKNGYGQCQSSKYGKLLRVSRAHQLSYEVFKGSRRGMLVCHTCDNPTCVNPDHLFLGTNNDNVQDMVSKNRHKNGGIKLRKSSFSYEHILSLKDKMTCFEASKEVGLSFSRVCQIWRGEYVNKNTVS